MENDHAGSTPDPEPPSSAGHSGYLAWPPPGLRRVQGDLGRISAELLLGGAILVIPLLLTMAVRDPFDLGGSLGDAWWIASLTSVVGVLVLLHAYTGAFRLLRRTVDAMRQGYGWVTVALTATDSTRDTGFLLQGSRVFSVLPPGTRRSLLTTRLVAASAAFLGALWLSVGFALALILAGGALLPGGGAIVGFTLIPTALAFLLAFLLASWSQWTVRRARRAWHARPWSADLEQDEIRRWTGELETRDEGARIGPGSSESRWVPAAGAGLILLGSVLVVLLTSLLVGVTSVSSILATMATPRFGATAERAAEVEPLRRYRLEGDESIPPDEAGEILQVLLHVGSAGEVRSPERPPVRTFEAPWLPTSSDQPGPGTGWTAGRILELFEAFPEAPGPDELASLRLVAEHPARVELERLARAPGLDVAAGRWVSPLPEGLLVSDLPMPRYRGIREGAVASQLAQAFLEAAEGQIETAELRIREVISVGLLLADEGPTLMDNLIGLVMVGTAGEVLEGFLRNTGREGEADDLAWARAAAVRGVELARPRAPLGTEQGLREMSEMVTDPTVLRGLRWDLFLSLSTGTPCLNLRRIVLGPDSEYQSWMEEAHASLVRWPSEEERFEMARFGYFGRAGGSGELPLLLRPLEWVMGGGDTPGSCAALTRQLLGAP